MSPFCPPQHVVPRQLFAKQEGLQIFRNSSTPRGRATQNLVVPAYVTNDKHAWGNCNIQQLDIETTLESVRREYKRQSHSAAPFKQVNPGAGLERAIIIALRQLNYLRV